MARAKRWIAITLAALSGCVTSYEGNEDSPYYLAPAGSRLTLHRALTIPADQVAVYFQDGQQVSGGVRFLYPHCKFEIYTIAPVPRTVKTDEFTITRVVQELVHTVETGGFHYARSLRTRRIGMSNDGPSVQAYATYMYLKSDRQPDVYRLGCGQWGYEPQDRHVTIAEIRRALGPDFTLHVAKSGR